MSEKTIAERLLIKAGYKIWLINAPANYEAMLGNLPEGVKILTQTSEPVDLIQLFISSRKELESQLGGLKKFLKPKGLLWLSYPKGTSKMKVDINRDIINSYAMTLGLQGVAMISIDETWSALRLKVVG